MDRSIYIVHHPYYYHHTVTIVWLWLYFYCIALFIVFFYCISIVHCIFTFICIFICIWLSRMFRPITIQLFSCKYVTIKLSWVGLGCCGLEPQNFQIRSNMWFLAVWGDMVNKSRWNLAGKSTVCSLACGISPGWWRGASMVKGKGFLYWLPSIGPRADLGVQAVSPQVTPSTWW